MDVSIVTVHLNDFDGLNSTYHSLRRLLVSRQINWLVIDGGSEVTTEEQGKCFDLIKSEADIFISEPDSGIYDAMNKGTRLASSDYVLYLNAGDELHPDFELEKLIQMIKFNQPVMIWGCCFVQYQSGSIVEIKTRSPSWAWYGMPVCHAAIFFQRKALGDNPYDTRFHIGADYDLVCRLVTSGATVAHFSSLVSIFHRGGISDVKRDAALQEENVIRLKNFRIPSIVGSVIKSFRAISGRLAQVAWLRGLWRRWI
jgi:putative colanic acid biosynthesis glycosyltransferase